MHLSKYQIAFMKEETWLNRPLSVRWRYIYQPKFLF